MWWLRWVRFAYPVSGVLTSVIVMAVRCVDGLKRDIDDLRREKADLEARISALESEKRCVV